MGRPQVRTRKLILDDKHFIMGLFGTVRNAYDRLGLEHSTVTLPQFKLAMSWRDVEPRVGITVEAHLFAWKQMFLRHTFAATRDRITLNPAANLEHEQWVAYDYDAGMRQVESQRARTRWRDLNENVTSQLLAQEDRQAERAAAAATSQQAVTEAAPDTVARP